MDVFLLYTSGRKSVKMKGQETDLYSNHILIRQLQGNRMKRAVQFGAGGIGRGFVGQLLSESDYEVLFVDVDQNVVEALNERGSYPLKLVGDRKETLTIPNVRALMADRSADVAEAIGRADVICTASGVRALPAISKLLATGLQKRRQSGAEPVNIIICENLN